MRSAIDEVAEEWVCPITHELPADPVMAEDGHIYERVAIEELIDRQGAGLKSPLTNETMGPKLMPSVQVRATIEKLVRTGAIEGDKADKWQQRLKEAEEVTELRQRAEGGDVCAMPALIWLPRGMGDARRGGRARAGSLLTSVPYTLGRCDARAGHLDLQGRPRAAAEQEDVVRLAQARGRPAPPALARRGGCGAARRPGMHSQRASGAWPYLPGGRGGLRGGGVRAGRVVPREQCRTPGSPAPGRHPLIACIPLTLAAPSRGRYSEESNDLLPKDVEQAKYWLGKVVAGTCHYKDQMERKRSEMATLLATL